MRDQSKGTRRPSGFAVTWQLANVALVIGVLYWAREIFIPLALAILLTFILAPVVNGLRRRGLGRTSSVIVTVVFAFVVLGAVGTMITLEFRSLANELPNYRQNIRKKISDLRLASKGGSIEKVHEAVKDVLNEIKKDEPQPTNGPSPVPVLVTGQTLAETPVSPVGKVLGELGSAGLVVTLVIFMLLQREDLRDRLLQLAGRTRLAATTKAIDEAGKLVSRYLLRQSLLNAGFGTGLGLGLFFIGVPYAVLWGFIGATARFIPYVGPSLGAAAPVLMSLAVFDGWTVPLLVIGLVIALELVTNMILEPLIYGQSIGVSQVALLIMIAFWTWLWGPIGLILATPLTVCLMVVSRTVPELKFISLLLGSEPALDSHQVFYQRLVARDWDEAHGIVEGFLKEHSRLELYEQLLIPTLIACRNDCRRQRLTDADQEFAFDMIRQIIEAANEGWPARSVGIRPTPGSPQRPLLLGCPANDEADELALLMLADLLSAEQWKMHVLSSQMLLSETIAEIEKFHPAIVCVGLLPPDRVFACRQWCRKIVSRFPQVPLVLGVWAIEKDASEKARSILESSADIVGFTLAESKNQAIQFAQLDCCSTVLENRNCPDDHVPASALDEGVTLLEKM